MMHYNRISTYISRCLCISLAMVFSLRGDAQKPFKLIAPNDETAFLRHVAVSADLVGPVVSFLSTSRKYAEISGRLSVQDRYFPVVELGCETINDDDPETQIHYDSKAPYFRVGVDYNVMKKKHGDYRIYVGGRYGFSTFDYTVSHAGIVDPVWGEMAEYEANGVGGNCHWLEAVGGVDVKISGPFRLGWSLRYKQRLVQKTADIGDPLYVPGFGKNGKSGFGGTFNVIFEL